MRSLRWIVVLLLCLVANTFAQKTTPPPAKESCGYPNYCARSDIKVEPYPKTPPNMPKAGSVTTDPVFGSRILRVTDGNTDPKRPGQSYQTPSSAEQNNWNTNSTKFYVKESGGRLWVYDFDPPRWLPNRFPTSRWTGAVNRSSAMRTRTFFSA